MQVIDHAPHGWFLVEDAGRLLLDVNCSHGAVGYAFLMELSPDEAADYRARGAASVDALASRIQAGAPGAAGSDSPFVARNVSSSPVAAEVNAAIAAWMKDREA